MAPPPRRLRGIDAIYADEETWRYLGPFGHSRQDSFARLLRNAGSWSLHGYGTFVLRVKGADDVIGLAGVFHTLRGFGKGLDDVAEAGWTLRRDHWGQGLAGEAMRAALAWFDAAHGPRRIACMIEDGNAASERLAGALGFAAYDRHEDLGDPVTLYERLPG